MSPVLLQCHGPKAMSDEQGWVLCPFTQKWHQWPKKVVLIGLRRHGTVDHKLFKGKLTVQHDLEVIRAYQCLGFFLAEKLVC